MNTLLIAVLTGLTFAAGPLPPAGPGAMAPQLTSDGDGALLTWIEPSATGQRRLRLARYDGRAWSPATTIAERDDFFANWADVPSVIRAEDGTLLAHWLQRAGEDTYAYHVMLARSVDNGVTWTTIGRVHEDTTPTEHGFVSMVREGDAVRAFWLDGRAMAGGHDDGGGNMFLRTALVRNGAVTGETVLDHRTCECCPTSAAMTPRGPIVVYRDRSLEGERDIFVVRRDDGAWTKPRPVYQDGWEIDGCPVNGPAIATHDDDVVVAWYTGAQMRPRVLFARSADGGRHFDEPIAIDEAEPIGRVAVTMTASGGTFIVWYGASDTPGRADVWLATVDATGTVAAHRVGHTTAARSSGMPRVTALNAGCLVVWTDPGQTNPLRMARVPR